MNKPLLIEFEVTCVDRSGATARLTLEPVGGATMPMPAPGQFVNILVEHARNTFLRRPISVNFAEPGSLMLMVKEAGEGTAMLVNSLPGDRYNTLMPLGHGFTLPEKPEKCLLIGGGVGVAPLLYLGECLRQRGVEPVFVLGARNREELDWQLPDFEKIGKTFVATEDGSLGTKGFVTQCPALDLEADRWYVCGPMPMMKAVAAAARKRNVECEVSLENKMACGLGACLCCVEDTADSGNVCTCTEGPVFNLNRLKW